MGKSVHDQFDGEMTYGECCQRYLTVNCQLEKLQMICPKCCHNLQQVHALHKNAEELTKRIRQTWSKTKRLNRTRHSRSNPIRFNDRVLSPTLPMNTTDENTIVNIKKERDFEDIPMKEQSTITVPESVLADVPYDLSNNNQRSYQNIHLVRIPHQPIENDQTSKKKATVRERSHLNDVMMSDFQF